MDYVRLHACLHPDKPAVTDLTFERSWTYEQFDHYVACCTAALLQESVLAGERVACLSKNRAEVLALQLACARLGAIFVPLNWRLAESELEVLIADCKPRVIYGDEIASKLNVDVVDIDHLLSQCDAVQPVWPEQPPDNLPSLMLYTSGTTGAPKGVMLSERNLTETAINFTLLGEVSSESHFLCESPMFHIIGMVTSIRPPLLCGGQISISDSFVPQRTFNRLADPVLKVSHYFCVPQMALAIRAVDNFDASRLGGLKAIFTGGAPHPETQIRDWLNDGIAIVDGYGSSEGGTVFGMPLDRTLIDQKAGCVGLPTPRVQARIVDEDGNNVVDGTPGELQLKGDNITLGYWQREDEYQASLTEDGWFLTGDILTKDVDGFYRVTDRKKDMYISGGENVYPVEIESQLDKYPGVSEVAVVGVPDAKWGEVGCLFYVTELSEIKLKDVEEYLSARIARYKIPKQIYRVDELPRNGVGKLMRHEMRKIYRETQEQIATSQ